MRPSIRVLSVAVLREGDRVLVERGDDAVTGARFLRAIGGGVEFGERAADAVVREWREELALDLDDLVLLGVLENLFTYEGRPGHEIVFVHDARLAGGVTVPRDGAVIVDAEGLPHALAWVALDERSDGALPLYPDGLRELLLRTR